jgi:hypothetical protein
MLCLCHLFLLYLLLYHTNAIEVYSSLRFSSLYSVFAQLSPCEDEGPVDPFRDVDCDDDHRPNSKKIDLKKKIKDIKDRPRKSKDSNQYDKDAALKSTAVQIIAWIKQGHRFLYILIILFTVVLAYALLLYWYLKSKQAESQKSATQTVLSRQNPSVINRRPIKGNSSTKTKRQ